MLNTGTKTTHISLGLEYFVLNDLKTDVEEIKWPEKQVKFTGSLTQELCKLPSYAVSHRCCLNLLSLNIQDQVEADLRRQATTKPFKLQFNHNKTQEFLRLFFFANSRRFSITSFSFGRNEAAALPEEDCSP